MPAVILRERVTENMMSFEPIEFLGMLGMHADGHLTVVTFVMRGFSLGTVPVSRICR